MLEEHQSFKVGIVIPAINSPSVLSETESRARWPWVHSR